MSLKEVFKTKSLKISNTFIDADGREKQVTIILSINEHRIVFNKIIWMMFFILSFTFSD